MTEAGKPSMSQPKRRVNLRRQPLTVPRWYALLVICTSMVLLAGLGIAYTSYVDGQRERAEREADRRWCLLLNTLDGAYSATPPTTELGREVAAAIHSLAVSLKCKGANA